MWPLFHRLVEPSPELRDPVDRLKARLIAGILCFVSPVGMIAIVWSYLADATPSHSTNEVLVELVALALMGVLIPWARGPRYRRAVIGFILIGQLLLCFVMVNVPQMAVINTCYMIIALAIATAFFGPRGAAICLLLNFGLVLGLGTFDPDLAFVVGAEVLSFQVIAGGVLVLAGVYREQLAREKQRDLLQRDLRNRTLWPQHSTARSTWPSIWWASERALRPCLVTNPVNSRGSPCRRSFRRMSTSACPVKSADPRLETPGVKKDGREFPLEAICQRHHGLGIPGHLLAVRDITERQEGFARLQITDRMAAMGTLAAGVAHEINNPLAFAKGNLERALSELEGQSFPDQERILKWLESASDGTERVERIVADLNTFVRDSGDDAVEAMELERAMDSSVLIASSAFKHRATLIREHEPSLRVYGHVSRLGQVLVNLLLNAAQAVDEARVDTNEVHIRSYEEDGKVCIEVEDNGPGIPPTFCLVSSEPFFTTKPVGVGTDLGSRSAKPHGAHGAVSRWRQAQRAHSFGSD